MMYIDMINNIRKEMSFSDLVSLIKGASITSMAQSDDFIEFGLSDKFNLRIQTNVNYRKKERLSIQLISTLNKGEIPPTRIRIAAHGEKLTAATIEKRIHNLRQLYATTFLIRSERFEELANLINDNPKADLEVELLREEDRLFIVAASQGSFWLTVMTKTQEAFTNLKNIAPILLDEGREAILERTKAETALKKIEVEKAKFALDYEKADKYIDLINKVSSIEDREQRIAIQNHLSSNLNSLTNDSPPLLPR